MVLERIGALLSKEAGAVARSPPLFGLVTGFWLMLAVLIASANAQLAFTIFFFATPAAMLVAYAGRRVRRRIRGEEPSENYQQPQQRERTRYEPVDDESAIEVLRERYAAGKLSDEEFERRLSALVETEEVVTQTDSSVEQFRSNRTREHAAE
ncbi:SHOCT domain-containing protein [Haloferax sp. S1W]|uniref:SHOCT domain-containing protein n=1 Tax=Haloferax sp. S1W TaxID=3377110 RepID=UPI0037C9AF1C